MLRLVHPIAAAKRFAGAPSPDTYGACDLPMITLPSTLTTVDLQHGYRSVGPIQREHATPAQPTLFRGGKIFTIQPFSRKCPIGHALDIPFENWTSSSLRIYISAVDDMGAS